MPNVFAPFKMNAVQTEKLNALRTGTLKVETFTEPKALLENPHFQEQRHRCLAGLSDGMIDKPIIELINAYNELPYCFTLQSCFGHFVCCGQNDPHNLEPLPINDPIAKVEYRIAYIAFCIEHSALGRMLLDALKGITGVIRIIFNSVAQNGFGKNRSILMPCKLSRTGSSLKTR